MTHTHTPTQNAMGEAGIPVDLSMVSPSASLQQDYAEFKQPDTNGDDKISRREVSCKEGMEEVLRERKLIWCHFPFLVL